jgi:hypothetical protein
MSERRAGTGTIVFSRTAAIARMDGGRVGADTLT